MRTKLSLEYGLPSVRSELIARVEIIIQNLDSIRPAMKCFTAWTAWVAAYLRLEVSPQS
jgi:hypothetical protein